jgi:hypothetical protein
MKNINKLGNVMIGLLCLIALVAMIVGVVLLTMAVSSVYAKDLPPGFSGSGMNKQVRITNQSELTFDGLNLDENGNLKDSPNVKFTQEILPAPKLPKATTQYIQQSAPKEYWQNTRTP